MKDIIMKINHVTGVYRINIEANKLEEIRTMLSLCLKGEQEVFTIKDDNDKETLYPAELLRNSVIVFEPDYGVSSFGINAEWNE